MRFTKPRWTLVGPDERDKRLPVFDVFVRMAGGSFLRKVFVVDSGADINMGRCPVDRSQCIGTW